MNSFFSLCGRPLAAERQLGVLRGLLNACGKGKLGLGIRPSNCMHHPGELTPGVLTAYSGQALLCEPPVGLYREFLRPIQARLCIAVMEVP